MRRVCIATAVLIMLLATAAPGHAATVSTVEWGDKYGTYRDVLVVADAGERNEITVEGVEGGTRVTDAVPLHAGIGCELHADGSVRCPNAGRRIEVHAGDLDDKVHTEVRALRSRLIGGDGDDVLTSGDSNTTFFTGGAGDDHMISGTGHDTFLEGPTANGSDVMEGDRLDTVSYEERVRSVRADLHGDADDGERGEGDRVGAGIGRLWGGDGADTLIGNARDNTLSGKHGEDLILGRAGDDWLHGGGSLFARTGYDDRIYGGPGQDAIGSSGGDDVVSGGRGHDVLQSGNGRDRVLPGPGQDIVSAGPANDLILARDGSVDKIDCGRGWDRLRNDPLDWQPLPRCERHDDAEVLGAPAVR